MATATTPSSQQELLELEIGAFMGPHIKRARIALVLIGALYAVTAYLAYGDIAKLHNALNAAGPDAGPFKDAVDVAYFFVVATGIAGVANIVLAAIAGTRATFAMYTAMAIFVVHSAFQLYVSGGTSLTSVVWWLTAIVVGMGFQAAWKAAQLRKERGQAAL